MPSLWYAFRHWFGTHTLWTNLRGVGNSRLAKATSVIPIVGAFLQLDYRFLDLLPHRDYIPFWRIHMLYYGACFIAAATVLFSFFCPRRIKKYAGLVEYTIAEVPFFSFKSHRDYYRDLALNEYRWLSDDGKAHNDVLDELHSQACSEQIDIARIMAAHFTALDASRPLARRLTFSFYALGIGLVIIPTMFTFFRVTWSLLQRIFNV